MTARPVSHTQRHDENRLSTEKMETSDIDEDESTCHNWKMKCTEAATLTGPGCNETRCSTPMEISSTDIKSSAVVKYAAVETPARFLRLSSNTNLNLPPSNWLRGSTTLQGGQWPYTNSNSTIFSSFHMANCFPDCIGEVDVVSDSENIKKLLKLPYSKSHISMMVHRIGKTLLLDEFDVHSHLLRASQKQWEWLRKFYFENVLQTLQEKSMLRKKKSRDYLQNKNMFSKFLYYSLAEAASEENNDVATDASPNTESKEVQRETNSPVQPFVPHTVTLPDIVKETEEQVQRGSHEFLRNVLWTFEDITMLIGSDMPIFGGGTYPAVSLRLRDMHKPINVLTGLDYWLDNLMCNVPEVVMCYHLDGIVQKYELLKTEDIPQMKNSQFSPIVIKDVAQNILSFLKSNATKSGHTYWLFKGKNDEVVKLYDLTTLCSDIMDDQDQNPFRLPVAMLLYRVACNMNERLDGHRRQGTIYKLLKNCLCLLNSRTHPQIVASVHYLLSDIYVPGGLDSSLIHKPCPTGETEDIDDTTCTQSSDEEQGAEEDDCCGYMESPSVDVKAFCIPNRYNGDGYSDAEKAIPPLTKNWEERCNCALNHVVQGLMCILEAEENPEEESTVTGNENPTKENEEHIKYQVEEVKMAKPFQPIPLHYSPIKTSTNIKIDLNDENSNHGERPLSLDSEKLSGQKGFATKTSKVPPLTSDKNSSWKVCCSILMLEKAAQAYATLSEVACSIKKYGQAMQHIKYGIVCYVYARKLVYNRSTKWPTELLSYLLSLSGDIHFMLINGANSVDLDANKNDFNSPLKISKEITDLLERGFEEKIHSDYAWAYEWPTDLENSISHSARCYEMALKVWPDGSGEGYERLIRRWGNICNELGVFYMNQAARLWNETGKTSEKITELWNKSKKSLSSGIQAFESVGDTANIALLNSNTGRLMRLWAHSSAPYNPDGTRKEFSPLERQRYNKAICYYSQAVRVLGDSQQYPEIWDSVNWEFSTTLFNMACLLQDFAPLSTYSQEGVEREICDYMKKALKLCETNPPVGRQPVYHYRCASVHHRLASLYHNAYRNQVRDDHRRKQSRLLADLHYSKACSLFSSLEHCNEYLRVLLERVGLWEHYFTGLTGFTSRVKTLHSILDYMVSARPIFNLVGSKIPQSEDNQRQENAGECSAVLVPSEDEEEKVEHEKLLLLLEQRLQYVIKNLMKIYSSKASKNEKLLKQWTQISSLCTKPANVQLEEHLYCFLGKVEPFIMKNLH